VSFFADVPEPEPAPKPFAYRTPEWLGPPANILGVAVPVEAVIVNNGDLAMAVGGATAFPTGVAMSFLVFTRAPILDDPFIHRDEPRFGVGFADGRKATTLQWPSWRPGEDPPAEPVLARRSGGGGGLNFRYGLWLWPLPPEGPLELVVAWPAKGIEEARATIDAGPIRAAAARAVELWPDERPLPDADSEW
jgi:hypothetical protein